jgi:hypothetical protein
MTLLDPLRWLPAFALAATLVGCSDQSSTGPDGGTKASGVGECAETCELDDDCASPLACNGNRCGCASDELCQVKQSWGSEGCTSDADCDQLAGQRCAAFGGSTFCVFDTTTSFGCGITPSQAKVDVDLVDGTGTIKICIDTAMRCMENGQCRVPFMCTQDADCAGSFGTPRCDLASGRCVCAEAPEDSCTAMDPGQQCRTDGTCGCLEDAICAPETGGHCFVDTGICGCTADDECGIVEVCHEGQCRCTTDVNACGVILTSNPGTTYGCVPLEAL